MTTQYQPHDRPPAAEDHDHQRPQPTSPRGAALLATPVVSVCDRGGRERSLTGAWFTLRALTAADIYAAPLGVGDYDAMLADAGYVQREWLLEDHLEKIVEQINDQVTRFRAIATSNRGASA